jgi:RecJ-like exonuclease
MTDDCCVICNGIGKNQFNENCTYCNGTGEPNNLAEEYLRNHICQCIVWNREFCPVCKKKCHHDTSLSPKQKIVPGHGGVSLPMANPKMENELVM